MIVIYNNNELTMRSGLNKREFKKKNSNLRCANLMVSLISVISCFLSFEGAAVSQSNSAPVTVQTLLDKLMVSVMSRVRHKF